MSRNTSTYLDHAIGAADEAQGRFKKQNASKVTGVPTYPEQPANSPWAANPVPDEPPLGVDVNALPDLGFERRDLGEAVAPVAASPSATVETASSIPKLRRRM